MKTETRRPVHTTRGGGGVWEKWRDLNYQRETQDTKNVKGRSKKPDREASKIIHIFYFGCLDDEIFKC